MINKLLNFYFKNKYVIIIAFLSVTILFISYKLFSSKNSTVNKKSNPEYYQDYSLANPNLKGKTLEELGLMAQENYVIAETGHVRRTQNFAQSNTIHELKFGTVIYTKNLDSLSGIIVDEQLLARENKKGFVAVYAEKPTRITDLPIGFMDEKEIISKEKFKDFKPEIKEEEIIKYSATILDAVETNANFDGELYQLSENAERSKKALVFGDFNNDGVKDMAVVVDLVDSSKSGLLIFFKSDQEYKLAYKKGFNSKVSAKTINKETPITLKSESTIFPFDGILISDKNSNSYFYIYDTDIEDFMVITKEVPVEETKEKITVSKVENSAEKKPLQSVEKPATKTQEKPTTKVPPKKQ